MFHQSTDTLKLRPSDVCYAQDSIRNVFRDPRHRQLVDTFRVLVQDMTVIHRIPPIPVIRDGGRYWAVDGNRRLYLYRKLESLGALHTIVVQVSPLGRQCFASKFTTRNMGQSIVVRNTSNFDRQLTSIWEQYHPVSGYSDDTHTSQMHSRRSQYEHNRTVDFASQIHSPSLNSGLSEIQAPPARSRTQSSASTAGYTDLYLSSRTRDSATEPRVSKSPNLVSEERRVANDNEVSDIESLLNGCRIHTDSQSRVSSAAEPRVSAKPRETGSRVLSPPSTRSRPRVVPPKHRDLLSVYDDISSQSHVTRPRKVTTEGGAPGHHGYSSRSTISDTGLRPGTQEDSISSNYISNKSSHSCVPTTTRLHKQPPGGATPTFSAYGSQYAFSVPDQATGLSPHAYRSDVYSQSPGVATSNRPRNQSAFSAYKSHSRYPFSTPDSHDTANGIPRARSGSHDTANGIPRARSGSHALSSISTHNKPHNATFVGHPNYFSSSNYSNEYVSKDNSDKSSYFKYYLKALKNGIL